VRRTIPLLSGLAILGVIFNHSNWHVLREFTPGALGGYPYILTDQIGKYAITAFLFIAGYFAAYATSGGKTDLKWEIVRARLTGLVWPWLTWAIFMTVSVFVTNAMWSQGGMLSLLETFLRNLFVQYYFLPLLIVYYLLAPFIARWTSRNLKATLIGAAVLQLIGEILFYASVYWQAFPKALLPWVEIGPLLYVRFAFFFPFGLAAGMFPQKVKDFLLPLKPALPWMALGAFLASALEASLVYAAGRPEIWPSGGDQTKLTSILFSLTLIACFIVYEKIELPLNKFIIQLGTRSYGLYLSHYVILGLLGRFFRGVLPWLTGQGWLLLPLLFVLTTLLAMGLMEVAARLPFKRFYRFVFG